MIVKRGITRTFLFLALCAALASSNVADAFFGNLFQTIGNHIQNTMQQVQNTVEQTKKSISVLSSIFGDGVTRSDLSIGQVFGGAFSRNNSIPVNGTATNSDWLLGDGSGVVAGISNGGMIAVSSGENGVTISTGPSSNNNNNDDEKNDNKNDETSQDDSSNDDLILETAEPSSEANPEMENEDMEAKFLELLEDWDAFVNSSIWKVQDEQMKPTAAVESDNDSLETSSRVINGVFLGTRAASGASFAVKFFYNNEENFYCSGSLIGYPYVLTAAHCGIVLGDEVRVGSRMLRSGYKATVGEVFHHPNFDSSTLQNDIAIVRLEGLVDKKTLIANGVKAARINRDKTFPPTKYIGVLSGHGAVSTNGTGVSEELRSTRHSIYEMKKCKEEITQGDVQDDESFMCAGDGERSTTCVGDSGGGLWHYQTRTKKNGKKKTFYRVFGVVSFGEVSDEALCPRGPPTVFQRVAVHTEWIEGIVGKKNLG